MAFANQDQFDAFIEKLKAWKAEGNPVHCTAQGFHIRGGDCRCPLEIAAGRGYNSWMEAGGEDSAFEAILPSDSFNPNIITQNDVVIAADCSDLALGYPVTYPKLQYIRNAMLAALGL